MTPTNCLQDLPRQQHCLAAGCTLLSPASMSRLLLQGVSNMVPVPLGAPPSTGISKAGMIYTFAFIGASTLVGVCFLMLVFKYVISYRHWRPPTTTPLQVGQRTSLAKVQLLLSSAFVALYYVFRLRHTLNPYGNRHLHNYLGYCISVDGDMASCSLLDIRKTTNQSTHTSRR